MDVVMDAMETELTPATAPDASPTPSTAPEAEPAPKRVKTEPPARTCAFCTSKKHVAAGCVNQACKKCCLARAEVCPTHPKEPEKPEVEPVRPRKPVLKNEFKETNFHYYGETVTIFCIRDFFASKKLSQGVLNDQERDERVSGKVWGRRKKRPTQDPKIKALVQSALGKRPLPSSEKPVEAGEQKVPAA